jgi:putative acetyltransferase
MADALVITIEPARSAAAGELIAALDRDLIERYPDLPTNGIQEEGFEDRGGVFAVGRMGGVPAACGAFRPWEGHAEIKRMFVARGHRGHGYGRVMLRFLEAEAARRGFARAVLETGTKQHEAIRLYESEGWTKIPQFGPYLNAQMSVCYGKDLIR